LFIVLGLVVASFGAGRAAGKSNPVVMIKTSSGDIAVELYADKAPVTVKNFLSYVDNKFYEGLIFHRVISSFMIQAGGFTKDMVRKEPAAPIANEADNGLSNDRGTIAMARTSDPHSASSQFYINVQDNPSLNFKSKDASGWGYCVFGKVISGMEVVDKIRVVPTESIPGGYNDVPIDPIVITKASRLTDEEAKALTAKKTKQEPKQQESKQ
jgi:peptidyl-prolyl cis-trans isomerase B (cyclophilin B)